jgi:hypothetical protein
LLEVCEQKKTVDASASGIKNRWRIFKLCKKLREFPDKFREYYRIVITTFDYILDSVKDDLQGYSNFRKCTEAEEKPTVALRYVLTIAVRININCISTMVNALNIQFNLKGNYTRNIKSYTKLQ